MRLTKIWNKFSTIDYTYDDAGQLWKEGNAIAGSGPNGTAARVQIVYKRYPNGQPAYVTYPQGWVSRRDYTGRGQLKTVEGQKGSELTIDTRRWIARMAECRGRFGFNMREQFTTF